MCTKIERKKKLGYRNRPDTKIGGLKMQLNLNIFRKVRQKIKLVPKIKNHYKALKKP